MDSRLIDSLLSFGLSRQEAQIYLELVKHGSLTGYEVSKETAISRSNCYASLSSLLDKGACFLSEEESSKYIPVNPDEFFKNRIHELESNALYIKKHLPSKIKNSEGYITIKGAVNIKNKIRTMLNKTEKRIYLLAPSSIVKMFENEIKELVLKKMKVVIITDDFNLRGCLVYHTKTDEGQIRFITDSSYVLTGVLTESEEDTCLYSGQENLVSVMKEALKNKIVLLEQESDKFKR